MISYNSCKKALWFMLLDVTCCAGSIPSKLGKLSALRSLDLLGNQLSGESNVRLGISGTVVVSGNIGDVCGVGW